MAHQYNPNYTPPTPTREALLREAQRRQGVADCIRRSPVKISGREAKMIQALLAPRVIR